MHNNIMAAGSRDRPSMLAPGPYPQWRSRFLRYVDTRPNGEALRKCILSGPYKPTTVLVQGVDATDDSLAVPEHSTIETPMNMPSKNKAHFLAEKEAIHLILTGIGDDIYSTVDACQTAQEMWEAIERLQQGLNIQDVKTNLFWEFRKFTSHDRESMESYYTRFYKLPEWSRFVTIVKQQHKLDEVSYHKLFDILKQYQNKVNELRAERLARNANPLALVATAQPDQDQYYQTSRSHRSQAPSSKPLIPTRSHTATRHKGKEIAKPITPPSETASKEDSDPEQAQRDNDMQKNLALIAKYFKKIYKPTNNNLRTSLNFKNKNVDTTPRYKNDDHSGQFGNQRTVNVAAAREKVGSLVVQKSGIQCFNCREFGHFAKECRKPKRVKDSAYHKEKMLLCKQAEQGVPLNTCLVETDDSNVIPNSPDMCEDDIQNEQNDVESNDKRVALANLIANLKLDTKQTEFEKYKAFNDCTIDYDKLERKLNKALGQLAQKDTVIREGLKTKAYKLSVVKQKHDELMKRSLLTKSHYEGLVKQKMKVITDLKLREEHDIEKMRSMEKQSKFLNEIVYKRSQSIQTIHMMAPKVPTYNGRPTFANPRYLKQAQSEISCLYVFPYDQTTHANRLILDGEETLALERESQSKLNKDLVRPYDYTTLNSLYEIFKPPTQDKSRQAYNVMTNNINHFKKIVDNAWIKHSKDQFRSPTAQDMEILIQTCLMPLAIKTQNDSFKFVHELKQEMHVDLKYVEFFEKEIDELESDKAEFSNMYDEILQDCVSKDVICSYLQSLSDLDALVELQCMYLHKAKECDRLTQKLSKQTESVSKKVHNELLQRFAKVEKHSISLEIALQKCKEQNIAISELKKLIEKGKGKFMDTKVDRPSVVQQPNAQRIPKPSVLAKKAVSNTNVLKLGMYRIDNKTAYTRAPQLPQTVKNTNPRLSTSTGVNHTTAVSRPQLRSNQSIDNVLTNNSQIVQLSLFIVDSGCTKHMTGNLKLLCNFVEKFLGTVRFGNDQFAPILGYGDLVQGNVMINRVYYVEGLNHNLFSVGQFCDADLEKDIMISLPKFKYVKDQPCSSCELSKAKRSSFKSKVVSSSKGRLNLLYIDLCGPMRVASINGKKYILVIVEDYSRYTWTLFLRSKDETPDVLKDFLTMIQRNLQALVITIRTDRGTEFLKKTLNAFFEEKGIEHQTSTARTPE
nr:Gag-Pol polyprotein [Tanacetum cinerariifolium]